MCELEKEALESEKKLSDIPDSDDVEKVFEKRCTTLQWKKNVEVWIKVVAYKKNWKLIFFNRLHIKKNS